jgi:N-acetylglucosaminyldiphosphoundecaprenol N-acetyl-beta-D-mannosaminyltransferase
MGFTMSDATTVDILGYPVSRRGLSGDLDAALDLSITADRTFRYAVFINPHSVVVAKSDDTFHQALHSADLIVPDGVGMLLGAWILGENVPERVAGTEFFLGFSELANKAGGFSYFFLGSSPFTLDRIQKRLALDFPNIVFAGSYSPPYKREFTESDNLAMIEAVNKVQPTVLWVGMTAPKQEKWIYAHRERLDVRFAGAIGAVFDFYAETTKRAPRWSRNLGLEWLLRLLGEPLRLWRRNLVSTPLYLREILRARNERR